MTIKIIIVCVIGISLVPRFKGGMPEEETLEMSPGDRQELNRQRKRVRGEHSRKKPHVHRSWGQEVMLELEKKSMWAE